MKKLKKSKNDNYLSGIVPDTMDDISQTDLIKVSRRLLDASIDSSGILEIGEMTPEKLREAKMVLGFLNATNNVVKTRMQFYKMIGITDDINKAKKNLKK